MIIRRSVRPASPHPNPPHRSRSDLRRAKPVMALLVWSALGPLAQTAVAAQLALPETPYSYTVIDQDLTAALHEFGSNLNIKVNVSPEVRGRILAQLELPA